MTDSKDARRCGHCGRDGATAWAAGVRLCHTDDPGLPDCYRRVTVYYEPVGALLGIEAKPGGITCVMREDNGEMIIYPELAALARLVMLGEELGARRGPGTVSADGKTVLVRRVPSCG